MLTRKRDRERERFLGEAQFLIEFLSILSRWLSFLPGELPATLSRRGGEGGGVTMRANQK